MDYGSVVYNNEEYELKDMAYQSNRVLLEYGNDLQYQGSGDTYMAEWECPAIKKTTGMEVLVRWHFEIGREGVDVSGLDAYDYEAEADSYDWDDVFDVKEV